MRKHLKGISKANTIEKQKDENIRQIINRQLRKKTHLKKKLIEMLQLFCKEI
jgi:hypothetical protein